jgi:poly-gamma-glutamate capsule biosynthesis protein CapA/YwtB (metallophosphatase superfamily)
MATTIRRLGALAALVALPIAVALVAKPALARKDTPPAPPLALTAPLPEWRAPGGRLVLQGRAVPRQRLTVRAGRRVVARGRAGPKGRFRIVLRSPGRAGAYPIRLNRLAVGTLRVRPLELAAVGDVNLDVRGATDAWQDVAPVLRRADLAVANLECAVSTRGLAVSGKQYTFRGTPAALRALPRAGLDAISVANNHSLDFGREAFLDTLTTARAAGLAVVGGGRDLTAARRPALFSAGGLRIALLGYSDVRPLGFDAGHGLAGTAPAFPELIDADVRAALGRADLVVVYFHWGTELARAPNARQRHLADVALASGATVVLGAHPHVLQPVERPDPFRLVAWSLGNFVFAANSPGTTATGTLLVHLALDGVRGARLVPARIEGAQPRLSD